jgi:hypothetical protein
MYRRELTNANAVKRMTDSFGHSNIFATLSLSGTNSQSHLIRNRGHPRANIRLSLERTKGGPLVFYPYPTVTVGTATDTRKTNIIYSQIKFQDNRQ